MLSINTLKKTAVGLAAAAMLSGSAHAAEDTIKVGVLHSLSGTMAISLSLIHISEPTRLNSTSRMPSSA